MTEIECRPSSSDKPIDVTFITDHMPTGDEKHRIGYAVSFGGNAVTAAFCCAKLGSCPT
jgi:hypothetical protein